jgi:hypothetical protein
VCKTKYQEGAFSSAKAAASVPSGVECELKLFFFSAQCSESFTYTKGAGNTCLSHETDELGLQTASWNCRPPPPSSYPSADIIIFKTPLCSLLGTPYPKTPPNVCVPFTGSLVDVFGSGRAKAIAPIDLPKGYQCKLELHSIPNCEGISYQVSSALSGACAPAPSAPIKSFRWRCGPVTTLAASDTTSVARQALDAPPEDRNLGLHKTL